MMITVHWLIPAEVEVCSGTYRRDGDGDIFTMAISQDVQKCIAALTFILGTLALLLNPIVLRYYRDKKEGVFPVYYSIISLCNVVLGVDAILHTVLLTTYLHLASEEGYHPQEGAWLNYMIFITYTLTTTARNSKIVYNTMLILMRAARYCAPYRVFSREHSAMAVLLFPIFWMLCMASSLTYHFSLPPEINIEQFIYFPEPNSARWLTVSSAVLLYYLPLTVMLLSLGVCLYKRRQQRRQGGRFNLLKLKEKEKKGQVVVHSLYGQSQDTDVAMTVLLLGCTLPYVVLLTIKVFWQAHEHAGCTVLFATGVVMSFLNSAFEPLVLILYNSEITSRGKLMFLAVKSCTK